MTYYPPTPPNTTPSTTTTGLLVTTTPLPATGFHYWHTVYFGSIMIIAGVLAMAVVRRRK